MIYMMNLGIILVLNWKKMMKKTIFNKFKKKTKKMKKKKKENYMVMMVRNCNKKKTIEK